MKININNKKILIAAVSVALILSSFIDPLTSVATNFLVDASERLMASLAIVTELKVAANTGGSSHIPFVSGAAKGVYDSLDKVFDYLILSNALVASQIILVNLSKSALIKIISLIFVAGLFTKHFHDVSVKALIIALMLNPGLALYVNALNYVSTEAKLDLGISLHQKLEETHKKYKEKEAERKHRQETRDENQLKKAEEKGRDKVGIFRKIEDKVSDAVSSGAHAIGEEFQYSLDVIKVAGKELVQLVINTLVTVIIVFLVLPLAYIYLVNLVLKRFFHFQVDHQLFAMLEAGVDHQIDDLEESSDSNNHQNIK